MLIREAVRGDLPRLMKIYAYARRFMASTGNAHQWIDGYPSETLIRQEIEAGHCHVCLGQEGQVVGVFCFIEGEDPNYARIEDGAWLNDRPYGTIHRLAASGEEKGVADACFRWCMERCPNLQPHPPAHSLQVWFHLLRGYLCRQWYASSGFSAFIVLTMKAG